jgi:mRNA-degrading endonuclease RelE of RelBE toxin-antitoxin system
MQRGDSSDRIVYPLAYRLRVAEDVAELLRSLHPDLKRKARAALDAIRADPEAGKALRHELTGLCSFRIGRFRIISRVAPRRRIDVVAVGPRRTIYEETLRLLRRP